MRTLPNWHELPKMPQGSKVSGCRACGLVFTTTRSFDKHRISGSCLTATELAAKGWSANPAGRWHPQTGSRFAAVASACDPKTDDQDERLSLHRVGV